jgi:hypothetical protein
MEYLLELAVQTGLRSTSVCCDLIGIIVPPKRRVCTYEDNDQIVKESLLFAIDLGRITNT